MRWRPQRGFSLIEILVVLVIVAVLAAVAIPVYDNYTTRSKMSEVVLAVSACRTPISDVYQSSQASVSANTWGCEAGVSASKYVRTISTDADGRVIVTAQNVSPDVDGRLLTLVPVDATGTPMVYRPGAEIKGWVCGGWGTTIQSGFLPSSCQGQ